MGLWLIQECRRVWRQAGDDHSWAQLTAMAEKSKPFVSIVDPDHTSFIAPGDMPARIAALCKECGQPVPADKGAVIRCALESLALKYRYTLECLEDVAGRQAEVIHVVGGGTQNTLLCQLTADATGRPVLAGPIEATAMGNAMMQAVGLGAIGSIPQGREVIRNSFELIAYEPKDTAAWDPHYEKFKTLLPIAL